MDFIVHKLRVRPPQSHAFKKKKVFHYFARHGKYIEGCAFFNIVDFTFVTKNMPVYAVRGVFNTK